MTSYDLIIVGGGIAGLWTGIQTLKDYPKLRCCILEKYEYIGGRINTFRKNIPKVGDVKWENGAGRISTSHIHILQLLQRYGLTFIPISGDTDYIRDPYYTHKEPHISSNAFSNLMNVYFGPIAGLSPEILATHTLKELLDKTIGPGAAKHFYMQFPYYAEIHTLRADIALESFRREMKSNEGFGVCAEGLSALTDAMMAEFISLGGTVVMNMELQMVTNNMDNTITLQCQIRNSTWQKTYVGSSVVLALHSEAIKKIRGANTMPVLKHLEMAPLLRMYAIFPTKNGISWFTRLNKIVTDSPIRFIIPVDSQRGIVMISYTDGADAQNWIKQDESAGEHGFENVKELVMAEIRRLFPDRSVPDPIFFKQHPWYYGCTYWRPGKYDVAEESYKSLHPLPTTMPNLFMCGESFAVGQCWIESALVQANMLLGHDDYKEAIRDI